MWEPIDERHRAVKEAELALLSSAVRHDGRLLAELLAEDFAEIGRSGRRWSAEDAIEALRGEAERPQPPTEEWLVNEVAPGLLLVTYLLRDGAPSRHASLWELGAEGPRLRYHQGTMLAGER